MAENTLTLQANRANLDQEDVILGYLDRLNETDQARTAEAVYQLWRPNKPLANTLVNIPVATSQERSTVGHAIDEYARQVPLKPFSIVLGLNINDETHAWHDTEVAACLDQAVAARRRHSNLDVRLSTATYLEPTIGEIRRDLWNGALSARARHSIPNDEPIIGINHDIDLVRLPRHYIATIQRYYENPNRAKVPVYTQVRHAHDPAHPHISAAVRWEDFVSNTCDYGYEAGAVIPMHYYAKHIGFDDRKRTHEIGSFIGGQHPPRILRTGFLETSPRRYTTRLALDEPIWTEDSFGSEDSCRNPEIVAAQADISLAALRTRFETQLEEDSTLIANSMIRGLGLDANKQIFELRDAGLSRDETEVLVGESIERSYTNKFRTAQRVVRNCLPLDVPLPPNRLDPAEHVEFFQKLGTRFMKMYDLGAALDNL